MRKPILAGMALALLVLSFGPESAAEEQKDKTTQWLEELRREQLQKKQPASSVGATQEDKSAWQLRALVKAGAVHRPEGFPDFPNGQVPFQPHQRIRSNRLDGPAIYATRDGYRIFKYLFCDNLGTVWVELSIMDKAKHRLAFAWQECGVDCDGGGECDSGSPLFVDLNGDARPELKFERLKDIVEMRRVDLNYWETALYTFQVDIVPSWVWARLGPDRRDECGIRPRDRVDLSIDHPLTVGGSVKSFGERLKKKP